MLQIDYKEIPPDVVDYSALYESTGWKYSIPVTKGALEISIKNTWFWICAYHKDSLVGIGRLISDGALYAFVCDMIVMPEYQNQGIGSSILRRFKEKCVENEIRRVWLFAGPDKASFYEKYGFEIRPQNMPGMQLTENC